jgi:hypothetical protein
VSRRLARAGAIATYAKRLYDREAYRNLKTSVGVPFDVLLINTLPHGPGILRNLASMLRRDDLDHTTPPGRD